MIHNSYNTSNDNTIKSKLITTVPKYSISNVSIVSNNSSNNIITKWKLDDSHNSTNLLTKITNSNTAYVGIGMLTLISL